MDKCTRRTARHSLRNAANTPPRLPRRRKLAARRSVLAPSPLPGRPPPAQTARRRRPRQQQLCRAVRHTARRTARNTQLHNPTPTRGPSDAHAPARPRSYLRRRGKPDGSSLVEAAQLGAKCGAQCGGQHDTCTQRGGLPCVGRAAPPWSRSARGATTARPQRRRRALTGGGVPELAAVTALRRMGETRHLGQVSSFIGTGPGQGPSRDPKRGRPGETGHLAKCRVSSGQDRDRDIPRSQKRAPRRNWTLGQVSSFIGTV